MRITRRVFHDLAIWMMAFGVLVGIVFPFFVMMLGVPHDVALRPLFYAACLLAGALAGAINYVLARIVVGRRLRLLADRMHHVEASLLEHDPSRGEPQCTAEACMITVDSDDEIGDSARAFNRLVETLAHALETQAAVRSFSEMLTSQLELENLAEAALDQFIDHTRADGGAILYEAAGQLRVAASHGLRTPDDMLSSDHVQAAMRSGARQVVQIPRDIRVEGVLADFRPREVYVLPTTYKGIPLGLVVLAKATPFDVDARLRMDLLGQGFGLALNNALAHDRLQRLAALDPLTGAFNRRFGLARLHEEFERAVRSNTPLGVLMLDIDHFKSVNDTYGHLVGDRLLSSITGLARMILREGDVLIRYGGEEFLAILPAASSDDVSSIAERIRRAVEESTLAEGQQSIRVTVSLGCAAYPRQNVEQATALVQAADDALYRAKEMGRNRVVSAN